MINIKVNGEVKTFEDKVKLMDLLDEGNKTVLVAKVNKRLRELRYTVTSDADVEFLDYSSVEARLAYKNSLRYLVSMAFFNIYPNYSLKFKHSVSRSIFCYVADQENLDMSTVLDTISKEMNRLVELDIPFLRKTLSISEAADLYKKFKSTDKLNSLKYRPDMNVHLYNCDGYLNYMYGYMVPSTGYLKNYKLTPYDVGFLVRYPVGDIESEIPGFTDSPHFFRLLRNASKWSNVIDATNIADLNEHIVSENQSEFVQLSEAKQNKMLGELGDIIQRNNDEIRLIAIAGPSSSGKTTFSTRLKIELMTRNIKPVTVSLDNYYLDLADIKRDADGNVDLENINTLDVELFNQNMVALIAGEEVMVPVYDFTVAKRVGFKPLKISKQSPIIIEGIHGLNPQLTKMIPNWQKYKIYITPQLQMNIDNHNPISSTDLRLLRRIVRDKKYRDCSAEKTLSMWPSVRSGEHKWVYPFLDQADYVYNSVLQYELSVLKKHALPTLQDVPNDSEYFVTANRLIKFVKYFIDIDDFQVPCNSLLREFIGGSCVVND